MFKWQQLLTFWQLWAVKPTLVGILTFMSSWHFIITWISRLNFMCGWVEHEEKNFYNLLLVGWGNMHGEDKQCFERKIVNIFLSISFYICFECSKEPSHWDGSFEYIQHTFWLRNKKTNVQLRSLIEGLGYMLTWILNKMTQIYVWILAGCSKRLLSRAE